MAQERKDILDRNETEKMCSLVGNEAGEMCSPADTDTCGDGMQISAEIGGFIGFQV